MTVHISPTLYSNGYGNDLSATSTRGGLVAGGFAMMRLGCFCIVKKEEKRVTFTLEQK